MNKQYRALIYDESSGSRAQLKRLLVASAQSNNNQAIVEQAPTLPIFLEKAGSNQSYDIAIVDADSHKNGHTSEGVLRAMRVLKESHPKIRIYALTNSRIGTLDTQLDRNPDITAKIDTATTAVGKIVSLAD